MAEKVIRLPDVGEGIAEAELVEWHVKVGDFVREDTVLGAVMTDKATIEIPSPSEGEVLWLCGNIGDMIAIGSDFVRLRIARDEMGAAGEPASAPARSAAATKNLDAPKPRGGPATAEAASTKSTPTKSAPTLLTVPKPYKPDEPNKSVATRLVSPRPSGRLGDGPPRREDEKPLASPAVRLRAREAGVDLRRVPGSGPAGRITHEDLTAFIAQSPGTGAGSVLQARTAVADVKMVGLRRRMAEKMSIAHMRIPHMTYVEEIDVTTLEELRASLNGRKRENQPRLTLLPFLMRAMVRALTEQPNLNAIFDDEAGIVHQHAGMHIGIASQTAAGLMVPVVRHAEALDLWGCAAEVNRLAAATKGGTATREELTGSTITITSLGAMGGVVSTPIINHPEVAIVGVNKIVVRPVWDGSAFIARKMMNLSSSFDHRVVDGYEAAVFIQRIKELLETPALIFMES